MFHAHRTWCLNVVQSPEQLAEMLTQQTWTLCTGFVVAGHEEYLFLNDTTHEDGAAEYAVIRGGLTAERHYQIESITFSWCSIQEAMTHVQRTLRGEDDGNDFAHEVSPILQTPAEHGRCCHCA